MANIGLYPVGGASKYYMLNSVPTATKGNLDGIAPQNVRGTVREQDVIPTFRQSTEGVASGSETPPTARATWRGFPGSFGLHKQSDAPGDVTRAWVSDLDNTRPGQLTAWLQWPGGSTVAIDNDAGGHQPAAIYALVNDAGAWGFVSSTSSGTWSYWRWDGAKYALQRRVQSIPPTSWGATARLPNTNSVYTSQGWPAPPIVQQTGTSLWMPIGAPGSTDISVAMAAGVGVANAYHTFIYFDILFVLSIGGGDITITPYRPRTPGAGNILQSATLAGLANCLGTITGENTCLGAVPCEGAVYIVTDRSVYAMQWNDQNNTILITKLFELPRFTSAPCVWNGEVYIGADNRIAHITPGQRGFDWRTVDQFGVMPGPFSGTIIQLLAMPDCLLAQTLAYGGAGSSGHLRMDVNGVWSCVQMKNVADSGFTFAYPTGPMIPLVDATNPSGFALLNLNSSGVATTATIYPIPQSGKNPRTLATSQRLQRPGPFRLISPYFDLEAEGAQKLLQRFAQAVLDASSSFPIRAYYQTDFADEAGADTFTTGCAKGTGTWHKCFYAAASSSAYAGSTDSGGRGQLWFEFDGSTTYADSIGTLSRYPTYKRVRFCLEVNGDTTGTTVPTILTTLFDRIEFVTKAFQRVYVLRLQTTESNRHSPANGGSDAVNIPDSATLITEFNRLKGYDGGKTLLTEVNEKGETRTVVMTKFDGALAAVGPDGAPAEYTVTVTVLDGALTGLS